jgi:hypothetical protein
MVLAAKHPVKTLHHAESMAYPLSAARRLSAPAAADGWPGARAPRRRCGGAAAR